MSLGACYYLRPRDSIILPLHTPNTNAGVRGQKPTNNAARQQQQPPPPLLPLARPLQHLHRYITSPRPAMRNTNGVLSRYQSLTHLVHLQDVFITALKKRSITSMIHSSCDSRTVLEWGGGGGLSFSPSAGTRLKLVHVILYILSNNSGLGEDVSRNFL